MSELEATMPSSELTEWLALLKIEGEEAQAAQQTARQR